MKPKIIMTASAAFLLLMLPAAYALTVDVTEGGDVDIGSREVVADFGMVTGDIRFKLGNLSWVPDEIWLIPGDMDPDMFSKGLTQDRVIELPKNLTSSTCRTAAYYNETVGYGFKIYNTGTTTQIQDSGEFCGLAFNGTYNVFAKY